jgi:hypothetical protein
LPSHIGAKLANLLVLTPFLENQVKQGQEKQLMKDRA